MKQRNLCLMTALFLVVLTAAAAGAEELVSEHFDQSYAMSENGTVSLENINGDVTVEVWDRAEVRVEAEKKASTHELLDHLKIDVVERKDGISIETDYPDHRQVERDRGSTMTVEYTLTVPRRAELNSIDLVNGDLTVIGVEGGARANTVNGSIAASQLGGDIRLATVNGLIRPEFDSLVGVESVQLESVNGGVEMALAASAGASLDVETVNGRITNDFGLKVNKHKYVGADLRGDIGGGGVPVEIETVNGGVEISQR